MKFKEFSIINKVMVMGSTVCNLNCDFCYLHDQHKSGSFGLLNEQIQKAWKDGTYVESIKKVFQEIECTPDTVDYLGFWGGEPLILAKNLVNPLYELVLYFKNLKDIDVVTNFSRIDYLNEMIHAADRALIETADKRKNKKVYFHVQLSIDAPPGPIQDNGHKCDWDIYRQNIERICYEVSQEPLQMVELTFELHSTVQIQDILKYLSTIEEVEYYLNYFNDFHNFINNTAKKYGVEKCVVQNQSTVYPNTANPYKFSLEDAMDNFKDLYLLDYIQHNLKYEYTDSHIYTHAALNSWNYSVLNPNVVCVESGLMGLTILPDGTICECPCDYILKFEPYMEWLKDNPLAQENYRDSLMKQKYYINPLTATQKEKDDFDWYIYDSIRLNNSTIIHMTMNLCLELALSYQIDYTYYKDPEKLLKHLYEYNNFYSCPREQIPAVKNVYLPDIHGCKRLLNGLAHKGMNDLIEDAKFEAKGVIKWKVTPELR